MCKEANITHVANGVFMHVQLLANLNCVMLHY